MSGAKHTPGPWKVATHAVVEDICSVYGVENQPTEDGLGQSWVYIVHEQPNPETTVERRSQQTANAHLIAASPTLFKKLSALCEIADDASFWIEPTKEGDGMLALLREAVAEARAALAAAEGRQP